MEQAETAATMVAECDKARTLWVHPDDAVLLVDCPLTLPVEADAAMARGTVRIETSAGWIEPGRSVYLDDLRPALRSVEPACPAASPCPRRNCPRAGGPSAEAGCVRTCR